MKILKWGISDQLPNELYELYTGTTYHSTLIKIKVGMSRAAIVDKGEFFTLDDLYKAIYLFWLFGGFLYKRTEAGVVTYPIHKARLNNEGNWVEKVGRSWSVIDVDFFGEASPMEYYPMPDYINSLDYIRAEAKVQKIVSGVLPNKIIGNIIITIPHGLDLDTEQKLELTILSRSRLDTTNPVPIVLSGTGIDIHKIDYHGIVGQVNEYLQLILTGILTAHEVTSPVIAGFSGSATLGGNANEIEKANIEYFNRKIVPFLKDLEDEFGVRFANWGEFNVKKNANFAVLKNFIKEE